MSISREKNARVAKLLSDFIGETDTQAEDGRYRFFIGDFSGFCKSRGVTPVALDSALLEIGCVSLGRYAARNDVVYTAPEDFRWHIEDMDKSDPDPTLLGTPGPASSGGAEIVTLRGVRNTAPDQPVADVIETLERLLDDARSGRLRGITYATALADGQYATGWTLSADQPAWDRMLAGTSVLQYRIMREANGEGDH